MRVRSVLRTFATVVGFAAVTAATTLAFVSPRTTFADDGDDMQLGTADGTRIDKVIVKTRILRDASSKTGWYLVIDALNEGDASQKVEFKTALERSFVQPMARVSTEVTTLLTRVESMTVAAHGKGHIVREVPAWIAEQLVTGERIQKARAAAMRKAEKDPTAYSWPAMAAAYPEFRVAVVEPNAKIERVRHEGGMAMMAMPPMPRFSPAPAPSGSAVAAVDPGF